LSSDKSNTEVKIAKITAFQGIIVALITAVAGVSAGYFARGSEEETAKQHWIQINSIDTKNSELVRLVITVNGINYSYPSKAVWAEVGPSMSKERFPLPIESKNYTVSFSAFLSNRGPSPTLRSESQVVNDFSINKLPQKEQMYYLYLVDGSYRAAVKNVEINYSVE